MSDRLTSDLEHARLIEKLTPAMRQAGSLIETAKARGFSERTKADMSPVTGADEAVERLLAEAISRTDPGAVIIGEEESEGGVRAAAGSVSRFWLIDPVDGTRVLVDGGDEYSVNVGLIEDGVPVLGLVLHPPSGALWTGASGLGAWRESAGHARARIRTRSFQKPPVVLTSASRLDPATKAWAESIAGAQIRQSSSSLKFCVLAEGGADIYLRQNETSEWDTAAADAILRAAGGVLLGVDGAPLTYGKPNYINPGFIAMGDPGAVSQLPPLPFA